MRKDEGILDSEDPIDRVNCTSNYQALIYPGRSHRFQPTVNSSPVFIVCGYHDREDIAKGMADLYLQYKALEVPAELHIYANAGHGFGV